MAIIKDGSASTELDVNNSAAKVYLSGAAGAAESYPLPTGVYMTPISFRHTAADAAASIIFAIRNSASKLLVIRRVLINVSFDGTAAATTSEYQLVSYNSISADSGATAQTPGKKRSAWPASSVTSVRGGGLVTLTGGAVDQTFATFGVQRQVSASSQFVLDFSSPNPYGGIEIDASAAAAIGIRLNAIAVIGDAVRGWIEWEER